MTARRVRGRGASRWLPRALLGTVLGLAAVELGLRLTADAVVRVGGYPAGAFVADEALGYRLAPGFVGSFESGGVRSSLAFDTSGRRDEPPEGGRRRRFRVLALGDSFGFGQGVEAEQAYPEVLERLLRKELPLEVVNASVPGYSTRDELALLRREGPALEPDLVLLGFYVGNDIAFNDPARGRFYVRSGLLVSSRQGPPGRWKDLRSWLHARSASWRAVERWRKQRQFGGADPERARRAACGALEWGTPLALSTLRVESSPEADAAYELTLAALGEMADYCESELGCPLVVVLLPTWHQCEPARWAALIEDCGASLDDFEVRKPQRVVRSWAEERGVPLLDLLPLFAEARVAEPRRRLYLPGDSHFSAAGHRLSGEALAEFLRAGPLLGAR